MASSEYIDDYSVKNLLELLKKSERYRDKYFKSRALRNIAWYNGNYSNSITALRESGVNLENLDYHVNLAYSTCRTLVSSVYNKFPEFSFFIKGSLEKAILDNYGMDIKFQTEKLEKVLELVTKIYFREMQARRTNRMTITDATLLGFGVTKLGYNVDFNAEKLKEIQQNYSIPKEKWVEFASNIEVSELVKKSEPYLLRVNPLNMLLPLNAVNFSRLSWQAEILYKDVKDVEKMYGVKGLKGTYVDNLGEKKQNDDADKVKLYEFHSLDPKFPYVCVLADGYDKFLEKKEHPLYESETGQIKNLYQYVWFNESYGSIYPLSDIDLVEPQIREANVQVEKRVEHIRKFVRMYSVKGVIDDDQMLKLKTGEDGTVIEIPNADGSVDVIPYPELSVDFYNNINMIRNEIMEVLGLTDYSIGASTQDRKATEAQLMERGRIDRVQERIDIIDEFCFKQIDTFVEMMKEYEQIGRMFNIQLNDERISLFFAGELLKLSDIDIQVVPGSTVSLDRDLEIRRMERLATVMMNANMAQPGLVNMGAFFKDQLAGMGYSNKYINEEAPMQPQNMLGNVPKLPGAVSEQGQPTMTPMMGGNMPNLGMPAMMGQGMGV